MYLVRIRRYARIGLIEERVLGPYRLRALAGILAWLHTFENRHVCQIAETIWQAPPSRQS